MIIKLENTVYDTADGHEVLIQLDQNELKYLNAYHGVAKIGKKVLPADSQLPTQTTCNCLRDIIELFEKTAKPYTTLKAAEEFWEHGVVYVDGLINSAFRYFKDGYTTALMQFKNKS